MNGCHRETGTESGLQAIRKYHGFLGFELFFSAICTQIGPNIGVLSRFFEKTSNNPKWRAKFIRPYI